MMVMMRSVGTRVATRYNLDVCVSWTERGVALVWQRGYGTYHFNVQHCIATLM